MLERLVGRDLAAEFLEGFLGRLVGGRPAAWSARWRSAMKCWTRPWI
jgi:hypothetical protein